ncbi:MAG: hypothetical protein WB797_10200 [Nocardioides sp.]
MTRRLLPGPGGALLVTAVLVLSGCGGGGSSNPGAGSSGPTGTTSSATQGGSSPTSQASSVQGVALTAQGTELRLGQSARVSWQPDQKKVGVLKLAVTKLQRVSIGVFRDWRLDRATRRSTPYFVHAEVKNLGRSDLSQVPVPLYLLDRRNTLLQASTFRARFAACPSRPLPDHFTHRAKATVCLVYFAPQHGKLAAISFRPTQDFDAITWHGPLSKPSKKKH